MCCCDTTSLALVAARSRSCLLRVCSNWNALALCTKLSKLARYYYIAAIATVLYLRTRALQPEKYEIMTIIRRTTYDVRRTFIATRLRVTLTTH